MTESIARTRVTTADVDVTVSTIRTSHGHYSTMIFDEHEDRRDYGKRLGSWTISQSTKRSETRAEADATHEAAIATAREKRPFTPTFPGGGI